MGREIEEVDLMVLQFSHLEFSISHDFAHVNSIQMTHLTLI